MVEGGQAELDFRTCEEASRRRLRARNPSRRDAEKSLAVVCSLMDYEEYARLAATPWGVHERE